MSDDVEVTVTLPGAMVSYLRRFWVFEDPPTYLDTGPGAVCTVLAAALPPPKMDEPTLLGTVVNTDEGPAVRASARRNGWHLISDERQRWPWRTWDEICEPRQVTPDAIERWSK